MKRRKVVSLNESKTRILRPSTGKTGDWLDSGIGGTIYRSTVNAWTPEQKAAWLKQQYAIGLADRNRVIGNYSVMPLGQESINTSVGRRNPLVTMNNCAHLKQLFVQYPITSARIYDSVFCNYDTYRRWPLISDTYWKDALSTALTAAFGYGEVGDDKMFSARAYWSMRPKFQSEASLINTIFELKDFSDVLPSMEKSFRKLNSIPGRRRFVNQCKILGSRVLSNPVSSVLSLGSKVAASAVLTWNLAIKPTITDALTIHQELKKDVYKLAREFNEIGEEGARSHYSERDNFQRQLTRRYHKRNIYNGIADGFSVDFIRTATAVFYQKLLWDRLEDAYPRWWGFDVGVDELWNMLPMSFVLDYMFTVGKTVEWMDRDDRVEADVVSYCESMKVTSSSGAFVIHDAQVPALAIDGVVYPSVGNGKPLLVTGTTATMYKRRVCSPYCGPALPYFKKPSTGQMANMLALARCLL